MAQTVKKPLEISGLVKVLPALTVVLALAYALAAYFLLFMPKLGPLLAGGSLDTAAIEGRLAEDEAYLKQIAASEAAFKKLNPERKEKLQSIVPLKPGIPDIYVQIDAIARTHDFVLISIDAVTDEKTISPSGRRVVRSAINLAGGTYEQFKLFLTDLERSQRIFDVQAIVFTPGSGNFGMILRSYYLDMDKPAVAPATQ
jgi:hypothetical protein